MINIEQFAAVELRTGTIVSAERVPETDKLLKLQVDIGNDERTMVAGIAEVYAAEDLPGTQVIVVSNLQPATIRGVESNGMVLAADVDGRPILATLKEAVPNGAKVR